MRTLWICLLLLLSHVLQAQLSEQQFNRPDVTFAPRVYWKWMNGHIAREGINLDLEALAATGLGGGILFNRVEGVPAGPIRYHSSEWIELTVHALQQADRFGLKWMLHLKPSRSGVGGPFVSPENAVQKVVWSKTYLKGGESAVLQLSKPIANQHFYKDIAVLAYPSPRGEDSLRDRTVNASKIIDLTLLANADGNLAWNAPKGNWTIVRFGHTVAEEVHQAASDSCNGLELDKLSRYGIQQFKEKFLQPLFDQTKPYHGRSLLGMALDSTKLDSRNWTRDMMPEFLRRAGYDLKPYLLAFTDLYVNSADETTRFFWDLHRVQSDMMEDYYFGGMRDILKNYGLNLLVEDFSLLDSSKIGEYPSIMKEQADLHFTEHSPSQAYVDVELQPNTSVQTGRTANNRNTAWFSKGTDYFEYLRRCQYVLQSSRAVVDAAYFMGEEDVTSMELRNQDPGHAFDVLSRDALVQKASVENNSLVLPDGSTYRFLLLPNIKVLSLPVLRKLKSLLEDGLWISASKPKTWPGILSVKEQTEWHTIVEDLWNKLPDGVYRYGSGRLFIHVSAEKIYEEAHLKQDFAYNSTNHRSVINYVHSRNGTADVWFVSNHRRQNDSLLASFRITGMQPEWWNPQTGIIQPITIFRQHDEQTLIPLTLEPLESGFVVFRHSLNKPAYDGLMNDGVSLISANPDDFPTRMPRLLPTDATDSTGTNLALPEFLNLNGNRLFRMKGSYTLLNPGRSMVKQAPLLIKKDLPVYDLSNDWDLHFPEGAGIPERFVMDTLISLHTVKAFDGKDFSGTSSWQRTFTLTPKDILGNHLILDLGQVSVLAEAYINGKSAGLCWKSPFRFDVTNLLKSGENKLDIRVTCMPHDQNESLPVSGLIGPVTLSVWKVLKD